MLSLCLTIALANPADPSAATILARCQQAYDRVQTFQENVDASLGGTKGTALIYFQRPSKLAIYGMSLFQSKYAMVSDGSSTWTWNGGQWSKVANKEMGIASITGISANAGTAVPAALFHTRWGNVLAPRRTIHVHRTKLNGRPMFVLDSQSPFPTSIWIDAQSYFLAKTSMNAIGREIVVNFGLPTVNRPIPPKVFRRS